MRYFRRLTLSQARWVGIDAGFVLALTGAALAGLGSTFTESEFWWIGMLGAFLAVLTTIVVVVMLRWPSAVAALVVVVWYFLLGPFLTLRSQDLAAPGSDVPEEAVARPQQRLGDGIEFPVLALGTGGLPHRLSVRGLSGGGAVTARAIRADRGSPECTCRVGRGRRGYGCVGVNVV